MNKQLLELQADRIEAFLKLHNVDARVTGGTVTPRWIRFQVLPATVAQISKIRELNEPLAAALDVPDCRVSRRGATVAVEVPRDDPRPVRLLPLYRQLTAIPSLTATLGLTDEGAPLLIRLPSPDVAHILVAGATGSGKTTLLQTIILSLAMSNSDKALALVLVDPNRSALHLFDTLPHLSAPVCVRRTGRPVCVRRTGRCDAQAGLARPVIRGRGDLSEVFQSLVRLMESRRGDTRGLFPHVVLAIDDLNELLTTTTTNAISVQQSLTRLLQHGREAGIHVIAATQKPAAVLDSLTNVDFSVRLVGRVSSANDARIATGVCGTGAERLLGEGDFLAVAEGNLARFQAAHVSPEEIQRVVQRIASESTIEALPEAARNTAGGLPVLVTEVFDGVLNEHRGVR